MGFIPFDVLLQKECLVSNHTPVSHIRMYYYTNVKHALRRQICAQSVESNGRIGRKNYMAKSFDVGNLNIILFIKAIK